MHKTRILTDNIALHSSKRIVIVIQQCLFGYAIRMRSNNGVLSTLDLGSTAHRRRHVSQHEPTLLSCCEFTKAFQHIRSHLQNPWCQELRISQTSFLLKYSIHMHKLYTQRYVYNWRGCKTALEPSRVLFTSWTRGHYPGNKCNHCCCLKIVDFSLLHEGSNSDTKIQVTEKEPQESTSNFLSFQQYLYRDRRTSIRTLIC